MAYVKNNFEYIYQEFCQEYQQMYSQKNQQKYLQDILKKFYGNIGFYESLALAKLIEVHENPEICNVVDLIGDDYAKWNNIEPVFIDAPTGSGKTTFVYKKLIIDAIRNGHGVLIVSNRIALSMQQKLAVYDTIKQSDYSSSLEGLKREEINKETYMIGPVCVITYQGLENLFNPDVRTELAFGFTSPKLYNAEKLREWSKTIRYTVFDEIHLLYADAEFNGFCHRLLRYIPFVFRDVIRIYMTATSYEVIDYIRKYEVFKYSMNVQNIPKAQFMAQEYIRSFNWIEYGLNVKVPVYPRLIHYTINPDYSRYELKFFSTERRNEDSDEDTGALDKKVASVMRILNPLPDNSNKAVIFVDNITVGEQIFKSLKAKGVSVALLTKDKSKPKEAREKIIVYERFDESVLITTQVLDSGVNIKDKSVNTVYPLKSIAARYCCFFVGEAADRTFLKACGCAAFIKCCK